MLLDGKVALITGAATGIGRAGASLFAREGARVVIADINREDGQRAVETVQSQGGQAAFVPVDLRSVAEIAKMVTSAAGVYGRIDIFWHNAGVTCPGHIESITEEAFDSEVQVSLKAAIFGTQRVIPVMRRTGGSILFTSSMVGLRPTPYRPEYSLTHGVEKAGLVMLMRCLTEPLAKYNIRVNCICPGPVATQRWLDNNVLRARALGVDPQERLKSLGDRLPIKRVITEDEIAAAAAFLVSDKAPAVTGVAFPVDGGFSAV